MINRLCFLLLFTTLVFQNSYSQEQKSDLKLWYNQPAKKWLEALPIGNGRLGAMAFGGVETAQLQLNEESIWAGAPENPYPKNIKSNYKEYQRLNLEGKYDEAAAFGKKYLAASPTSIRSYEPLGNVFLKFNHGDSATNYKRELNIENGINTVTYTIGENKYRRQSFISSAYDVIFYQFEVLEGNATSCEVHFEREKDIKQAVINNNTISIKGQIFDDPEGYDDNAGGSGKGGYHLKFASDVKVITSSGEVSEGLNNSLQIKDTKKFTLIIGAATNYNLALLNFDDSVDANKIVHETIKNASDITFEAAKNKHIPTFSELMNRVEFNLGDFTEDTIPTDIRLKNINEGNSHPYLNVLFFQYGRYLLASSAAFKAKLPANLQGIWSNEMWAAWEADFHLNINLQMNYWPADVTNLSETFVPLTNYMERLAEAGKITADKFIGSKGWVAHHVANPYGRTTPSGSTIGSQVANGYSFPLAGAWMSLSLWRHYQYTKNIDYLKKNYPIIEGATQFILDFLIENKKGELVTSPSYSPENRYIDPETGKHYTNTVASTIDIEIINDMFSTCLEAEKILGINHLSDKIKKALPKLPEIKIGKDGTIQEWYYDYEDVDPAHRHVSHLYALYPSNQFAPSNTNYFNAAKKTIDKRLESGGGQTGWSRAWTINFYARLLDGNTALHHANELLKHQVSPNLFDLIGRRVFQIDGNLGTTAGIAEMLMQSYEKETIRLLPALPDSWDKGSISGLIARGNFEIAMNWEHNKLTSFTIKSNDKNSVSVIYNDKKWDFDFEANETRTMEVE
ncbi:glycoside hydrolase family 95 protein [Joostella atrarenae]|uniref:Glycoside hydrolase family 95 protein n=1 Tax=Joostella atrarenae TaxID=679257 RepID=A0ABS9IZK6_9FLAO|nr:glycoside hydrolase family 95 protein [Joostella atrarenae]MCF8713620.1 glycoside hydrolase family 95 protein [Joostella atrarenae]